MSTAGATRAVPTEAALLLEVPAAEVVLADVRWGLDPAAELGVPTHVTALFPFVAPAAIDDEVRLRVAAVAAASPALDLVLARTAWFGEQVLWLAPENPGPLRRLTAALAEAFPAYPPYGGEFDDVVPHLTVGQVGAGVDLTALRAAETRVAPLLPITQRVERLSLWIGGATPGSWRRLESYAFGS